MPLDHLGFQQSITQELNITKDRVRKLISTANWGEEGRYKEAILKKVISQYLPQNLSIATGFIVAADRDGNNAKVSTQLDLIIYENNYPPVFKEGDFVIVTEDCVKGVIEVKSNIRHNGNDDGLLGILSKFQRLEEFDTFRLDNENKKKRFIGLFAYKYERNFEDSAVANALIASNGLVNHISLGKDKFIRFWENSPDTEDNRLQYRRYNLYNLSFSYFISNLLHIVSTEDPIGRYWFSFPIAGTKEQHMKGNPIFLNQNM